ncbi:MAG: methyl-accepting chemotaxis protein [Deltaproteobacteria bacterium]|nr:methyl-accepting chemotaxis protein [Deltaproteobacteria bacterium]
MKNIGILTRLITGISFVTIVFLAFSLITFFNLRKMYDLAEAVQNDHYPTVVAVSNFGKILQQFRRHQLRYVTETSDSEMKKYATNQADELALITKDIEALRALPFDPEEKSLFSDLEKKWKDYLKNNEEQVMKPARENKRDEANQGLAASHGLFQEIFDLSEKLEAVNSQQITEGEQVIQQKFKEQIRNSLIGLSLVLFLAVSLIYWLTLSIKAIANQAATAAAGDLSKRIPSKDSLSKAINKMMDNLSATLKTGQEATHHLASATLQLKTSIAEESTAAAQQNAASAEVLSTSKELASSAQQIAKNAQGVAKTADQAKMNMEEIQTHITSMIQKILKLGERSQAIGTVVKIIDDLAERTNLLALNAAIEAARAGEAGKGFAVVAGEVNKLAERSTEATGDIRELIKEIQGETNSAVVGVEDTTKRVSAGLEAAKEAARLTGEISIAIGQQRSGIEQIVIAIKGIDQVTKQFVDSTQQTSATVAQLDGQANKLNQLISNFKV